MNQPYMISVGECRPFIETAQWHDYKVAFCIAVGCFVLMCLLIFVHSMYDTYMRNTARLSKANKEPHHGRA